MKNKPVKKLESPLADSHYWGDDYCELAGDIKEFVDLKLKPDQMLTYNSVPLEEILHYVKVCLFTRDYENFNKIARLFERAVADRPERAVVSRKSYAYEEAITLSGKNSPLKRHVLEALGNFYPKKSRDQLRDMLKDFEKETGSNFGKEVGKGKGGRPRKGTGLYDVAKARLKSLSENDRRIVEFLLKKKSLLEANLEAETRAKEIAELAARLNEKLTPGSKENSALRDYFNS